MADDREQLGRLVRETWVKWACEQENPKNSWLTGWDELDDGRREVDMRIGEAVAAFVRERDSRTRIVSASGVKDLEAIGNGPLLDPDCRDGKHSSCMGAPCECPVPGVHATRHEHERSTA